MQLHLLSLLTSSPSATLLWEWKIQCTGFGDLRRGRTRRSLVLRRVDRPVSSAFGSIQKSEGNRTRKTRICVERRPEELTVLRHPKTFLRRFLDSLQGARRVTTSFRQSSVQSHHLPFACRTKKVDRIFRALNCAKIVLSNVNCGTSR